MLTIIGLIVFAIIVILAWTWFKKHNPDKEALVNKVENTIEDKLKK